MGSPEELGSSGGITNNLLRKCKALGLQRSYIGHRGPELAGTWFVGPGNLFSEFHSEQKLFFSYHHPQSEQNVVHIYFAY